MVVYSGGIVMVKWKWGKCGSEDMVGDFNLPAVKKKSPTFDLLSLGEFSAKKQSVDREPDLRIPAEAFVIN